jgi:pimeloyl-ACP methyl ester carboxylesterase
VGAVVLVHGVCVDATCWDGVAAALRKRGHRVEAVDLHRGTLAADTAAVQEVIDRMATPVVVCGWSYGGMVVTGLDLPAGSHLVYLCALMPDDGESAMALMEQRPADIANIVVADETGDFVLAGDDLNDILWEDAPAEATEPIRASLRTQAGVTLVEPPARVAWHDTPSTYVVTMQDRVVHPDLQREMAKRATHVIEWNTSHSPVLSTPEVVVGLLDELAVAR